MDRGAWPTRVQGLAKSQTRLSDPTTTTYFLTILENRHPRLRCQQVWVLPETSLLGFQVGTFSLGLQVVIAVCVCARVQRLHMWLSGKKFTCQLRGCSFNPWVGKLS